jgi:large subunit ribosomal protein L15
LQKRLPKFGFTSRVARVTAQIRTSELDSVGGEVINLDSLRSAGIIGVAIKRAKIFLSGEVTKPYIIQGLTLTAGAKAAIEKAGGRVEA